MNRFANAPLVLATLLFFCFPVSMAAANILMGLFLIAFIFSGNLRLSWDAIKANPVNKVAVLMYAVILLGLSYSPAPTKDMWLHVTKYYKLLFIPLLYSVLDDPVWQQRGMQAFAAGMLFILGSTWLNVWFVLPWSVTQTPGWGISHHVTGDYITQNVMMSFFVLLSLSYARIATTSWKRYAWLAIALLAAVSITHLSEGRTGYLLLIAVLALFAFSTLKGKTLGIALFGGFLFLGATLASSTMLTQRFELAVTEAQKSNVDNQTSIGHRLYNYKKAVELIREKPILGWGTGAYHTEACRIVEKPEWCQIFSWHPHNQFLFFWVENGVLGLLVYFALIASLVRVALGDMNTHSRALLLGFAGLLTIDSLFNSPLFSSRENHFFTIMMALLIAQSRLARQSATQPN